MGGKVVDSKRTAGPPESLKWGVCFSRNLGELKKLPVKLLATARYQA